MAVVAVGYYVGSLAGLAMRVPDATPSILWPPNAILTGALLATPPRHWLPVLLSALPAHLAAQLPLEWPTTLVLAFFVTNCTEAVIGAAVLRRLSDSPTSLDTVARLAAFLFAVVLCGPLLSSFADAAVARWLHGDLYWLVWRNRVPANVLTQLVVTPVVAGALTGAPSWLRRATRRRVVEVVALAVCLIGVGILSFGRATESNAVGLVVMATPLAVYLPFMVWASVRFGPAGASLAMVGVAAVSLAFVANDGGPYRGLPPERMTLAIQLFLALIALTLLTLAALIEERRQTMHVLDERLRFATLVSEFARGMEQASREQLSATCRECLHRIGASLELDCVRLFQVFSPQGSLAVVAEWTSPEFTPAEPLVAEQKLPWTLSRVASHLPTVVPSLDTLPSEADRDRAWLAACGYRSVLILPLVAGDRLIGAIAFGSALERSWPRLWVTNLSLLSEVLANALARREANDALVASEEMKSAILNSLTRGVAVLDWGGCLVDVNDAWVEMWTQATKDLGDAALYAIRVGDRLTQRPNPEHDGVLAELSAGAGAILQGTRERCTIELTSASPAGPRWWRLDGVRLQRPQGGAVLTLVEITQQRRTEIEAQHHREQLARVARLSTMGELAASLAHQLNQPLTAVMSNAQAAQRLLHRRPDDHVELCQALDDVVNDARRASKVVSGVRELLRGGEMEMAPLDLASLTREVAALIAADAALKRAAVVLDLEPWPVMVRGDRVQLQQVVLNLIVNALEAVASAPGERVVHVACHVAQSRDACVTVRDSGAGFAAGAEKLVFEPLYTTKPQGMGMGLSIARTIVDSHGGAIRARATPSGTVFEFTLPLLESAASARAG